MTPNGSQPCRTPGEVLAPAINLSDLVFSAKIDFVSVDGLHGPTPAGLKGTCKRPCSHKGRRLTIHDPAPGDLVILQAACPNACLSEIEVSVDVAPRAKMSEEDRARYLATVKTELFAKRLTPQISAELSSGFRGSYIPRAHGFNLHPFNHRIPGPGEQHLHGTKYDGVQVKVYLKVRDNKKSLHWGKHVVRVEVRLNLPGLVHHRLERVGQLLGFQYRKELTPYFRHVRGTARTSARKRNPGSPLLQLIQKRLQQTDDAHWRDYGVGPFLRGGKRNLSPPRLLRHQELNDRIGQALHRLQQHFSPLKFVCGEPASNG